MKTVIEGNGLSKTFQTGEAKVMALRDVDIRIEEGEFVAIMGASGSGKSTLLYILSAIEQSDGGNVRVLGNDVSTMDEPALSKLRGEMFGFVFQQPTMLKNLSISENILLPALHAKTIEKKELIEESQRLMHQTGIGELGNRSIAEVSGGQLQRAGLCRALLHRPKIVFADEPTGALDSKSGEEIMDLFSTIHQEGMTILLVTHDANVAARAQRVLFMKDGEIRHEIRLAETDPKTRADTVRRVAQQVL